MISLGDHSSLAPLTPQLSSLCSISPESSVSLVTRLFDLLDKLCVKYHLLFLGSGLDSLMPVISTIGRKFSESRGLVRARARSCFQNDASPEGYSSKLALGAALV
jgi:hypothetical protein